MAPSLLKAATRTNDSIHVGSCHVTAAPSPMPVALCPAAARSAASRYSANVIVRLVSSVRNRASGDSCARRSTNSHNVRPWIIGGLYCYESGHRYGLRAPFEPAAGVQTQEVAGGAPIERVPEGTLDSALAVGRHGPQVVDRNKPAKAVALGDLDVHSCVRWGVDKVEFARQRVAVLLERRLAETIGRDGTATEEAQCLLYDGGVGHGLAGRGGRPGR